VADVGTRIWFPSREPLKPQRDNVVKRGERVILVREQDGGRTQVQAVAVDSGAISDSIRVRAIDGRHEVLRGQVCATGVVRGETS
jgi:flagella basal body P-ring formation protein FlgA